MSFRPPRNSAQRSNVPFPVCDSRDDHSTWFGDRLSRHWPGKFREMKIPESRCTAYHEAAHAVIYLHFGIDVEQVTLCPDEAGLCSVSDNLPPSEGYLIAILAGSEADKLLLAGDPDALGRRGTGWKEDFERAVEVFC